MRTKRFQEKTPVKMVEATVQLERYHQENANRALKEAYE